VFADDLREAVKKRSDRERCRADGAVIEVPELTVSVDGLQKDQRESEEY
jgi:hypothetical protein